MPKQLEERLMREAKKKGYKPGSKEFNAYVYGTMRRMGWKPKRERKKEKLAIHILEGGK